MLAFLIAFFNQLSGINAVLYFAKRIFEQAGFGGNAALLVSVGLGVTNFIFTYVGLSLIDRLGRKSLMYIGSFGYIVSLGMVSWAFYAHHPTLVPIFIFAFIAAHAIGQGTVIWVFIAEIFPNEHRARGQTLGSSTHWVFAALLTTYFPTMVTGFPSRRRVCLLRGNDDPAAVVGCIHDARNQGNHSRKFRADRDPLITRGGWTGDMTRWTSRMI